MPTAAASGPGSGAGPLPEHSDLSRVIEVVLNDAVDEAVGAGAVRAQRLADAGLVEGQDGVAQRAVAGFEPRQELRPRALPSRRTVWAHRHDGVADLLFLDGRTLLTSRQVGAADPAELAREIRRSLPVVRWSGAGLSNFSVRHWQRCSAPRSSIGRPSPSITRPKSPGPDGTRRPWPRLMTGMCGRT